MVFLFEGLDKAGKSTLIRNFQDLSHINVFKNPIKPTKTEYSKGFINGLYTGAYLAAKLSNEDLIFDRSHITELAYAEVKRKYKPEVDYWKEWEEKNSHWVIVVYIDAPLDLIKARFETDKEEYVKPSQIKSIAKKYEKYFQDPKLRMVYIDGSVTQQRMLDQLVSQLKNLYLWSPSRPR